ncbi:hypothetical protein B0H17DRAFT_1231351 [Mycena rosella]|uniref:CCHC-type domain-containing protein n=1 Tax=Mycena rosella TaxID=1033263 RepID=A0AAD7E226_MYCRO|nr:hypothetical protein B0H17DRAFT_1231351 [Mycena rosella]
MSLVGEVHQVRNFAAKINLERLYIEGVVSNANYADPFASSQVSTRADATRLTSFQIIISQQAGSRTHPELQVQPKPEGFHGMSSKEPTTISGTLFRDRRLLLVSATASDGPENDHCFVEEIRASAFGHVRPMGIRANIPTCLIEAVLHYPFDSHLNGHSVVGLWAQMKSSQIEILLTSAFEIMFCFSAGVSLIQVWTTSTPLPRSFVLFIQSAYRDPNFPGVDNIDALSEPSMMTLPRPNLIFQAPLVLFIIVSILASPLITVFAPSSSVRCANPTTNEMITIPKLDLATNGVLHDFTEQCAPMLYAFHPLLIKYTDWQSAPLRACYEHLGLRDADRPPLQYTYRLTNPRRLCPPSARITSPTLRPQSAVLISSPTRLMTASTIAAVLFPAFSGIHPKSTGGDDQDVHPQRPPPAPARPPASPRMPCPRLLNRPVILTPARSYDCGQQGHIAGCCPNTIKCHLCGEEGHISKQCTTAEQTKRTGVVLRTVEGHAKEWYISPPSVPPSLADSSPLPLFLFPAFRPPHCTDVAGSQPSYNCGSSTHIVGTAPNSESPHPSASPVGAQGSGHD